MRVMLGWIAAASVALMAHAQTPPPTSEPEPPARAPAPPAGETPASNPAAPDAPAAGAQGAPTTEPSGDNIGVKPASEMTIDELLAGAERFHSVRRFTEALSLLQILLNRDPENSEGLLLRSQVAWDAGNPDLARSGWLKIKQAQPNEFRANYGLGKMYAGTRVWRQALTYLEVAESVAPSDKVAETRTLLSLALRGVGRAEEARQMLERALQADPKYFDALDTLVTLRAELQDFDRAIADADSLIKLAEEKVREERSSYESLKRLDLSYAAKLSVLQKRGETLYVRNTDATSSEKLLPGMGPLAAQTINGVIDTLWRRNELAGILRNFEMVGFAEKAVEYQPEVVDNYVTLGLLQNRTYQYEKARDTFFKALNLDPTNKVAREQAGIALTHILDLDPANEAAKGQLAALQIRQDKEAEEKKDNQ